MYGQAEVLGKAQEHGTVLLSGIVGSRAYGLSHAGSDVDRLGMFAAPTVAFFSLAPVSESHVFHDPSDATFHEAGKYLRLLLAANPTAGELLWLSEYEVQHPLGTELVSLRSRFLSATSVKGSYLSYAVQQYKKILAEGSVQAPTERMRKHALHMARLINQGYALYTTGEFTVRVENPDWYREFREASVVTWQSWFEREQVRFATAKSCLQGTPDFDAANAWLRKVRYEFLDPAVAM